MWPRTTEISHGQAQLALGKVGGTDENDLIDAARSGRTHDSFDKLPEMIGNVYTHGVQEGEVVETPEGETPTVPRNYTGANIWYGAEACQLHLVNRR